MTIYFRWESDPECSGVFPIVFSSVEKTLNNHRSIKFHKSPKTCYEIEKVFEDETIRSMFCLSFHKVKYEIYDTTFCSDDFSYCIYSSKKSIELIKKHVPEEDRFLVMDATFSITPNRMFYQVLIIYARYFEKVIFVSDVIFLDIFLFFSYVFLKIFLDLSVGICHDESQNTDRL